jgi:hypothetical protein
MFSLSSLDLGMEREGRCERKEKEEEHGETEKR